VIIGRTWLDADQVRAGDALGLSRADRLKLRDVGQGEFYAFGPALGQTGVAHFRSDRVRTTHPRPGQRHLLTAPAPSRAIRGVLGKFADLPHEADEEIRSFDEARWRITEMERQIKHLKGAHGAQQINDQAAVDSAVKSAVERERVAWQRKLEQGRARFRKLTAALASTGQSLGKVKELLEETEREWLNRHAADTAPRRCDFQRQCRRSCRSWPAAVTFAIAMVFLARANDRVASAESLDGPLKFTAGERRILTALAQYPQGRSKVQVAVLTGYAATGGGFNNYLGALRSRGLIDGDGDRLTITGVGTQALGSWEPLPTGSGLVDYWRTRLGRAERLILEALTCVYPDLLSKEEVAAKAGYEANGGGFNNALGRLRTLELVQGRGQLKASDNLFDAEVG
jgi:hypothetical protein